MRQRFARDDSRTHGVEPHARARLRRGAGRGGRRGQGASGSRMASARRPRRARRRAAVASSSSSAVGLGQPAAADAEQVVLVAGRRPILAEDERPRLLDGHSMPASSRATATAAAAGHCELSTIRTRAVSAPSPRAAATPAEVRPARWGLAYAIERQRATGGVDRDDGREPEAGDRDPSGRRDSTNRAGRRSAAGADHAQPRRDAHAAGEGEQVQVQRAVGLAGPPPTLATHATRASPATAAPNQRRLRASHRDRADQRAGEHDGERPLDRSQVGERRRVPDLAHDAADRAMHADDELRRGLERRLQGVRSAAASSRRAKATSSPRFPGSRFSCCQTGGAQSTATIPTVTNAGRTRPAQPDAPVSRRRRTGRRRRYRRPPRPTPTATRGRRRTDVCLHRHRDEHREGGQRPPAAGGVCGAGDHDGRRREHRHRRVPGVGQLLGPVGEGEAGEGECGGPRPTPTAGGVGHDDDGGGDGEVPPAAPETHPGGLRPGEAVEGGGDAEQDRTGMVPLVPGVRPEELVEVQGAPGSELEDGVVAGHGHGVAGSGGGPHRHDQQREAGGRGARARAAPQPGGGGRRRGQAPARERPARDATAAGRSARRRRRVRRRRRGSPRSWRFAHAATIVSPAIPARREGGELDLSTGLGHRLLELGHRVLAQVVVGVDVARLHARTGSPGSCPPPSPGSSAGRGSSASSRRAVRRARAAPADRR